MTENPHENEDLEVRREKPSEEPETDEESGAWSTDQKRRSYYYDDACGYEIYDSEAEEEDAD